MKEVCLSMDKNNEILKNIIKEAVREVIEEEFMKLRLSLVPYISDFEQKEIKEKYSKPSDEYVRKIKFKL